MLARDSDFYKCETQKPGVYVREIGSYKSRNSK